jgi:hypothetical protein
MRYDEVMHYDEVYAEMLEVGATPQDAETVARAIVVYEETRYPAAVAYQAALGTPWQEAAGEALRAVTAAATEVYFASVPEQYR